MEGPTQFLVFMDVPGIKKYVFGTERLVEIRGASALLDRLNRVETEWCLKERLGDSNVETVYSNGGRSQFIVSAFPSDLKTSLDEVGRLFYETSGRGLRLLWGTSPFTDQGGYAGALAKAFLDLKEKKEERGILACSQMHTGYVRECSSCSGMASEIVSHVEESLCLCTVCKAKLEEGRGSKRAGHWGKFRSYLIAQGLTEEEVDRGRPADFEEIGEQCSARRGYTAVVYADGNAMGRLVKSIETKDQFRLFSETVDQSIRAACHEALFTHCKPSGAGIIPADILLLGGDDLVLYTTAEAALPIAIDVAEKFTEKTSQVFRENRDTKEGRFFYEKLQGKGLTISLGIAYGKSHTPFSIMLDQAEELLKSAKKAGAKDPRAVSGAHFMPTYIDYHIASHYNQVTVEDSRNRHLEYMREDVPIRLSQKPYSLEDVRRLLDHATALSALPRSRMMALGSAMASAKELGWMNATMDCLKIYGRTCSKEHRQALFDALQDFGCASKELPWKVTSDAISTVLLDLIEISEFVARES